MISSRCIDIMIQVNQWIERNNNYFRTQHLIWMLLGCWPMLPSPSSIINVYDQHLRNYILIMSVIKLRYNKKVTVLRQFLLKSN